ncbi:MAG TPA: hypothetical protein VG819_13560 [Rhizomicrobium sp.]|nr:hypothetical protein [Rhizomicrobium sp.]
MAATVLLIAAGLQLALPSSLELPQVARRAAPARAQDTAPAIRQAAYPAILAHPIFAPDRAPPPVEADASGNLSGYEVIGTAIAGNAAAAAVLRDSGGEMSRVKIGETIDGWKLVSIEPEGLVFDRNGERRSLAVDMSAPRVAGQGGVKMGKAGAASGYNSSSSSDSDDSDDDDDEE